MASVGGDPQHIPAPSSAQGESLELRVRRAEANLLRVIDESPEAIAIHRSGKVVYVNPAGLELFGYELDQVRGHPILDFVSTSYRRLVADRVMQTYIRPETLPQLEERLLRSDGSELPVEVLAFPMLFEGVPSTLVHMRDIRKQKELEAKLRAADRLASVGLVAAGIAHEIDNPLTYALLSTELLEERIDRVPDAGDREAMRAALGAIRDGVERAARIARDVSVFSRPPRDQLVPVDIHRVLDSCTNVIRGRLHGHGRVVKRYGSVPQVLGSETQLAQVFLNLLTNAVDAVAERPDGEGVVTITTSAEDVRWVRVEVHDDGPGIPRGVQEHLFDLLFTTKPHGTGLGLPIAKQLTSAQGGTLALESASPDRGTTFSVTLHAAPPRTREEEAVPSEPPARPQSAAKRILIVDDEPRLAASLELLLCDHQTRKAACGREALAILRERPDYDLILCDLHMADVDGADLYEQIRSEWPGLEAKLVFMTGGALTPRTEELLGSVPNRRLAKPFEPGELLGLVDRAEPPERAPHPRITRSNAS